MIAEASLSPLLSYMRMGESYWFLVFRHCSMAN